MDDRIPPGISENGKHFGKKYHPNAVKDVKRKLSFMNKKICDLHHQRKFAYKNSVKVKKMIHNQVNQIVKCLRARERSLWADVDEAYISQDANITDELSTLQSIHARCQVLFNHLDDFKGNGNTLSMIYSLLAEVNFEKSDVKPLEFISEFEIMKSRANSYGHLEGDFSKKDDFFLVDKEKDCNLTCSTSKQFLEKEQCCKQNMAVSKKDLVNNLDKFATCKEAEFEDSFQIIDLFDNLCCHDINNDCIMYEEESQDNNEQSETEYNGANSSETGSKCKVCDSFEHPDDINKSDEDFNPDEEWKHIQEMRDKIANFKEMLKPHEASKRYTSIIRNGVYRQSKSNKLKISKENKFLLVKDAESWLCDLNLKQDLPKKKSFENISPNQQSESNLVSSPADLIQKAFKPYLIKDNAKNWLSCK